MSARVRIPRTVYEAVLADLARPHPHAYERVGFLYCRRAAASPEPLLLAFDYRTVADDDYLRDSSVGARIGSNAIHSALQTSLTLKASTLHVHQHAHSGPTFFSGVDLECLENLMPTFSRLVPDQLHGGLVLSLDRGAGALWSRETRELVRCPSVSVIGRPFRLWEAS